MHGMAETRPRNTYALTGPQPKAEPGRTPLRGDLAHIGLAGKFFVPHYAVPQPRIVMPGGAPLLTATGVDGEVERVESLVEEQLGGGAGAPGYDGAGERGAGN